MRQWKLACLCLFTMMISGQVHAGEAGARAYANAPVGLNVMELLYFQSETSGGAFNSTTKAGMLRYYRYFELFGQAALVGGYIPYASAYITIPALGYYEQVKGISDPTFVIGMDFFGAPAVSFQEFCDYRQDLIIGGSLQVIAPFGRYDKTRILNPGGNRWVFKPELAISQAINDWIFEIYGNYHYFSRNHQYLGNLIHDQKGRWGVDAHISYTLKPGMWVSFDYLRQWSGETSINTRPQGDKVRNTTIGFTANIPLFKSNAIQLEYRDDVKTRSLSQSRSFSFRFQQMW
ncbi:MAG: hypothetical protein COW18_06790 [Zetaproteobacteria bacterium CG12_big_fil_rev_8_21_14_0_65_54_13]|nr:MAG: hypothetical protein COX55_06775 [Zetaproteobacteria bacterium CG23_combo_of_CG06-09_8_20_14_all_54_7]PIW48668.1 MAG: hypothetical protein COW18_06790 [Zetaproteobacteria bacterium CG12_big_fil_rev_8_21_14_0_65_54_13]PIX54603.1 MAG: hypothetical protein COZ50_07085 [Zetaproteobacteria bacterium CG_4_10_14_3_um_filter_54_28]PJA27722.1 MAG: hypothetical protein CO188_11610 [Zetaproteobacteria bacterium CG_4_9_14_3_um_filter_54_145]